MEPSSLKILVVDSKGQSRQQVCSLLRDCSYQVTPVRTGREALQLLAGHTEDVPAFDLILKEHEPPGANAVRLLRKLGKGVHTRSIPVVVMSTQDDREVVATCLNRGATDYLVKPLRHNELRHIWTRVWWWQRNKEQSRQNIGHYLPAAPYDYPDSLSSSSSDGTKCSDDEDEPTSKEGSAPDANAVHGSNGNGSNGSKEGNGTSRVDAKPHGGSNGEGGSNNGDGGSNGNGNGSSDNKNGNGSSDNKNGNGNSANKNGHHGSNGNGASTTVHPERRGSHALVGTAEGRVKQGDLLQEDHTLPPKSARAGSAFAQYVGPSTTSRKRPASDLGQLASGRDSNPDAAQQAEMPQQQRRQPPGVRERLQVRISSVPAAGHAAGDDPRHVSQQGALGPSGQLGLSPRDYSQQGAGSQHFAALQSNLGSRGGGQLPWQGSRHPQMAGVMQGGSQGVGVQAQGMPSPHAFPIYPTPSHFGVIQNSIHPLTLYSNSNALSGHHSGHQSGSHPGQASLEQQGLQSLAPPPLSFLNPEQIMVAEAAAANLSQQAAAATTALASNPQLGAMLLNQLLQLNQTLNPQQHPQLGAGQAAGQAQGQAQQQGMGGAPPPQQQQQQHMPVPSAPPPSLTTPWRPQVFTPQLAMLSGSIPGAPPQDTSLASGGTNGGGTNNSNGGGGSAGCLRSGRTERDSRQLALDKYRNKRKNLKFGKTIRYESRKALAQQRPRLKGQFVKHSQQGSSHGNGNGTGEDSNGGGAGGRSRGLSVRYWQNGAQDEQNQNFGLHEDLEDEEYDREEEDEEEEEDDEMCPDGQGTAHGQVVGQGLPQNEPANVEEMDVVDSLRELGRQASLQRQAAAAAVQGAEGGGQAGAVDSEPVAKGSGGGGQSHSHHSRGSNERGSHELRATRSHSQQQQYQRSAQASNDPRGQLAQLAVEQRESQRAAQEGSNGNAKNGSDSGSNSPDDNAREQKPVHGHGHGHGHSHGHRYE